MKYKVHIAYITPNGQIIKPGVYDETEIDVTIARSKTIITAVDATVKVVKEENPLNEMPTLQLYPTDESLVADVRDVVLTPVKEQIKVENLLINQVPAPKLEALKHIGKATVQKVLDLRQVQPFQSYDDLNHRVPLPKAKKWEDVALLDFASSRQMDMESNVKFI